jgi:hypothetical protein
MTFASQGGVFLLLLFGGLGKELEIQSKVPIRIVEADVCD